MKKIDFDTKVFGVLFLRDHPWYLGMTLFDSLEVGSERWAPLGDIDEGPRVIYLQVRRNKRAWINKEWRIRK